jgi:hypothetical protein
MTFSNAHLSRRNHSDAFRQPAFAPIYAAVCAPVSPDRHGFEFAMQVGRHTPWPTHRIRCFLLSQTKAKLPQSAP